MTLPIQEEATEVPARRFSAKKIFWAVILAALLYLARGNYAACDFDLYGSSRGNVFKRGYELV